MTIFEEDAEYKFGMSEGSRMLLQAIKEAEKGYPIHPDFDRFIWGGKDARPGDPSSGSTRHQVETIERLSALHEFTDGLRVSRDPCPRCGIRGDVGCVCKGGCD